MNNIKIRTISRLTALAGLLVSQCGWAQYAYSVSPGPKTLNAVSPPINFTEAELGFYPSISIIATRHSNTFRTGEGSEAEDTVVTVALDLGLFTRLGGELGRHTFYASYRPTFDRYDVFSDDNAISHNLDFGLNLDFTERFDATLRASYATGVEERGSSGTPVTQFPEPNDISTLWLGAQATYGLGDNMFSLFGAVDHRESRFENNGQESRDRDADSLTGRIYYNVGPSTRTFLEGVTTDIDYLDPTSTKDSTEMSYSVGVDWQATAITSAHAKIGQLEKDYDDPAAEDYSGATYLAGINWNVLPFTNVLFNASRLTEESPETGSNFFVSNLFGIGVNHSFTNRINVGAHANKTRDEFDDGREDDIKDYSVNASYEWFRWLSVFAQYGITKRTSNLEEANYDDQYISLGLTATRLQ